MSRQQFITGRAAGATAFIAIGAALMLTGCGTSAAAPPATGGTSPSQPASTPAHTTGASSPPGGSSHSLAFPTAVGTTWVYRTTVGIDGETGKTTKKVVANRQVPAGQRVTIAETNDIAGTQNSSRGYYVVHPDGSISFPFSQLNASSTVTSTSSILFPSTAALQAETPFHSTIVIHEKEGTQAATVTSHVTVQGKGTASVTVPAGHYTATLIEVTMTEKVLGHTVSITVTSWDAPNVGIVKSQAVIHEAGIHQVAATDALESFTRG